MAFERQFRLISYLAAFCGFLALWVSSTFGIFETILFIGLILLAWNIEGTRWQISERVGTALVVLSLPLYYVLWRFRFFDLSGSETVLPGILARLILTLTGIKLLQKKSDRDWMFLFLMAFFEVLLAAGLSISIAYFASFVLFVFVMAGAIILFQIRKAARFAVDNSTVKGKALPEVKNDELPIRQVLGIAAILLIFISVAAVPVFFLLPRVSAAGFGGSESVSALAGFSDSVRLGGIGQIQLNEAIVMRVRIENEVPSDIHWRGVALDTFDGQYWSRSKTALREPKIRNERDLIQVDSVRSQEGMTLQTIYLEPLDTPVIFGLYRMIGIQGNFPVLYRDAAGAISFQRTGDRVSYKVLSDTSSPATEILRNDTSPYPAELANYLQVPKNLDPRIPEFARTVTANVSNRYDIASEMEKYLQSSFGYTLQQKAGGADPLADFLFNVKEGHCEYFATSMAIMLRTQGIATRVVNGFQRGEYNDTADVFVVRQSNAHSWVEVYFPETDTWVPFDPTPPAGQNNVRAFAGISSQFRKYAEALETFWIQYFVAFDNQEQRSLLVSVRNGFNSYESGISSSWNILQQEVKEWWARVRGDEGIQASLTAVGWGTLILAASTALGFIFMGLFRKLVKLKIWRTIWNRTRIGTNSSAVVFYERMQRLLESKSISRFPHQTPLEFAHETRHEGVVFVTEKYNSVRFGDEHLSNSEIDQIEGWLKVLATNDLKMIS